MRRVLYPHKLLRGVQVGKLLQVVWPTGSLVLEILNNGHNKPG